MAFAELSRASRVAGVMFLAPNSASPTATVPAFGAFDREPSVAAWFDPAVGCYAGVPLCLAFASPETAAQPVLGVPAVARALREVLLAGWTCCTVAVPGGWHPCGGVAAEIARLAPGLKPTYITAVPQRADLFIVHGEELASARELQRRAQGPIPMEIPVPVSVGQANAMLTAASRRLQVGTAKPGDGIVARHLNRPLSQAISRAALRWFGPLHPNIATLGTALIGAVMLACLLRFPGYNGLLLGALLFQCASIFDGVDGELARATFRATSLGGTLDSLVDAATNLLFFAGVVYNLYAQDDSFSAALALIALGGLTLGTALLGRRARKDSGAIDFNAVKHMVARDRTQTMQLLTWLTMRDFYAAAALVLIACGLIVPAVWAFAIVVTGWLVVVLSALARLRPRPCVV